MTDVYQDKIYAASSVFSAAAPVDKMDLFSGRIDQLQRVIDVINTRGQHAIIFGERGVGKTSLANILLEVLHSIGKADFILIKVNCDSNDNFVTVWKKALERIEYTEEIKNIGYDRETKQYIFDLTATVGSDIYPDRICRTFERSGRQFILVFDEFDRINDREVNILFTDTMKSLSDNSIHATLILVGVADNVDDLVSSHESIARSLKQVKMPRMNIDELKGIITKGISKLDMEIDSEALERIVRVSQGLPHYTHLLGIATAREALKSKSLKIGRNDFLGGIEAAVIDAQHSVVSAYQKATSSAYKGHLYSKVLLACALTKGDDLGYFAAGDIRGPLEKLTMKKYDIPAFSQHLNAFSSSVRGNILQKTGEKRNYRYRFRNPLIQPYVVMRGAIDGFLNDDLFDLIPTKAT